MSFDIDVGHASERGARPGNEDFAAVVRPAAADAALGWIAAIADGVSTGGAGREAAQTAVMSVVQDYYAAPPLWDTTVVLERVIGAQNAWLADHNRRRQGLREEGATALTTLTALVLRGHSYTLAHVGDTRAWLLRGDECTQLSQDHSFDQTDFAGRLTRALGLDDRVRVDYLQNELHAGDVFVLTSDGVHGALRQSRIAVLARQGSAQQAADALVRAALEAGSGDNATALVLHVRGLDAARLEDMSLLGRQLPLPPRVRIGDTLDHFTVTALIADNGVHRLFQARDNRTRELVAIKTLSPGRASDPEERAMLAHEAWLGSRLGERAGVTTPAGFVRVREETEPSAFYVVFDWHAGRTLEQLLAERRAFSVTEVVPAAIAVARALGRLHRSGVIHRDIKPGNLHLGDDGQWRILDLSVALSGREPKVQRTLHAGTPSYINPEQWAEEPAPPDAASDLYAFGVTLYLWLTGKLPYGEIEPYQTARFRRDPIAPSRTRPDVPRWLDHVVLKAVARDAKLRFETAEELLLALERGASRPLPAPGSTPLVVRDPSTLWKIAFAISLLFNVLLVIWLLFLPR